MSALLRIGGVTIGLSYRDERLETPLPDATLPFTVDDGQPPDLQLAVEMRGNAAAAPARLLFDSGAVWQLYEEGDAYRIDCRSDVFGDEPYKTAIIDRNLEHGVIRVRPLHDGVPSALEYPLDELLVNAILTRRGGIEIHSCGVIDSDGAGYLFAGNSEAGKTTTAGLWAGEAKSIVSDDRVIVREENGTWWMYGTPWHGTAGISSPERAPLRQIFLLEKASANEAVQLSPAAAVARLFSCAFPPFHDRDGLHSVLGTLERLVTAVPVARLAFIKDPSAVAFARAAARRR